MVNLSIDEVLLKATTEDKFLRIHKSYIINLENSEEMQQ